MKIKHTEALKTSRQFLNTCSFIKFIQSCPSAKLEPLYSGNEKQQVFIFSFLETITPEV